MADKQQQQLLQQDQLKVLRIGMVKEGKVVDERIIRAGENVTIGDGPKSTFPFATKVVPARFVLFQVDKKGGYTLNFVEKMDGKLSVGDKVQGLEDFRKSGQAKGKAGQWALQLDEKSRGKISIGDVTFLFQFVPAPLESMRQLAGKDFRPKLIEEDDAVFYAFLGVFTTLAAVLMVFIYNTEIREITLEDIPPRLVELVIPPPAPPTEEAATVVDDGQKAKKEEDKPKEDDQPKEATPKREMTAEEKAAAEAAKRQREADAVMQSKLLLGILGTRGETASGDTVVDVFSDQDAVGASLKDSLANVSGAEIATSAMGVKGATAGGGRADASIGELGRGGGGSANVGSGPATKVRARSDMGAVEAQGEGDVAQVKKDVSRYGTQVQACYEQRLKENPSLTGRLMVAISVNAGRVTSVGIEENGTGDKGLETCVIGRVKTWRFDQGVSMDLYLPFSLSTG